MMGWGLSFNFIVKLSVRRVSLSLIKTAAGQNKVKETNVHLNCEKESE